MSTFVRPEDLTNPVDVGGGVRMLKVDDERRYLFEHSHSWGPIEGEEDQPEFVATIAPALHPQHVVVSEDPLTITPSLLCSSPHCGLHGFVTDGVWRSA